MTPRPSCATLVLALVITASLVACTGGSEQQQLGHTDGSANSGTQPPAVKPIETFPTNVVPESTVVTTPPISTEDCQRLSAILDAGPSTPLAPGNIDFEHRRAILDELEAATAAVPPVARPAMQLLADAYALVLDELANFQGDLAHPETFDPEQISRINQIISSPEVQEATAELEALARTC